MKRRITLQKLAERFTSHRDTECRTRQLAFRHNDTVQPLHMLAAKPLPDSKPKSTRGPTVTKLAQRLSKIPALLHQGDELLLHRLVHLAKGSGQA